MSRARNIKPSFFSNEELAEVEPLGRLLFAGMWCEADRAGRMEDRPKRIKASILPYDNCDIDALLNSLAERGFILRYAANGHRYIQIVNFCKHQNPHVKEAQSTIPAPDSHRTSTGLPSIDDEEKPGASPVQELEQAPDEHDASTVHAQELPERATLIPSSLIPEEEKIGGSSDPPPAHESPPETQRVPYQAIVDLFNATMTGLPKVREVSDTRRTLMRRWWQASKSRQSLNFVRSYFEECAEDDFLNGTGPYGNGHKNWRPSFEFLLDKDRATQVYERAMHRLEQQAVQ